MTVAEFFTTSTSSATMVSAREPVSCPVMPTDFTEGDWSGLAGPTSNARFELRWSSRGFRCASSGMVSIRRFVKMLKASARSFEADTTRILCCGSFQSSQQT